MGLALHHQYLQAIMVVQMNVQHRLDFTFEGVLQMSKVTHQLAGVMVIHHRDGADGLLIGTPFFFDDALANQIAYGLGPVGVALLLNLRVETLQQNAFYRHTETYQIAHTVSKKNTKHTTTHTPPPKKPNNTTHQRICAT